MGQASKKLCSCGPGLHKKINSGRVSRSSSHCGFCSLQVTMMSPVIFSKINMYERTFKSTVRNKFNSVRPQVVSDCFRRPAILLSTLLAVKNVSVILKKILCNVCIFSKWPHFRKNVATIFTLHGILHIRY